MMKLQSLTVSHASPSLSVAYTADICGKCHYCRWQVPEMSLANAVETAGNGTEQ